MHLKQKKTKALWVGVLLFFSVFLFSAKNVSATAVFSSMTTDTASRTFYITTGPGYYASQVGFTATASAGADAGKYVIIYPQGGACTGLSSTVSVNLYNRTTGLSAGAGNYTKSTSSDGGCLLTSPTTGWGLTITAGDTLDLQWIDNAYATNVRFMGSAASTVTGHADALDGSGSALGADPNIADFAFTICDSSGGCIPTPPTPPDTSTHFTSFSVATSTEMVTVAGFWNKVATTTEYLDFFQTSATLGQEATTRTFATTSGAFSFTFPYLPTYFSTQSGTSTTISGSNLTLHAKLWHYDGTDLAANGFGLSTSGNAPILMDATSTTLTASSSVVFDTSFARSMQDLPVACGLTDLGGCLQNMVVWLFYPTPDTLAQFSSVNLNGKFPFTYIYQIGQIRNSLFTSTTTVSTALTVNLWKIGNAATSTIELISRDKVSAVPFSGTIYTVLTFLIWILMAEYIYYRVIRIHDVTTPSS